MDAMISAAVEAAMLEAVAKQNTEKTTKQSNEDKDSTLDPSSHTLTAPRPVSPPAHTTIHVCHLLKENSDAMV